MHTFQAAMPVVIHALYLFSEYETIIDTYLLKIFWFFGVTDPMRLFRSVILQQVMGTEYQCHYRQFYPEIKSYFSSCCSLCGVDTMMRHVGKITNSMASWKLTMIQASMIKIRCPELLSSGGKMVPDIDVTTILSSSSKKEGAESGYNKLRKGKRPASSFRPPSWERFSSMRNFFRAHPIRRITFRKLSGESDRSAFP